jgi:nitric oxide reductase NorD protein
MEEWGGMKWHKYIVGKSRKHFPKAKVDLESIKSHLSIFFRAMGGEKSFSIENTSAIRHGAYQSFVQKLSATGQKTELAHFGREQLYLPSEVAYFNDKNLNRDLYIWLTAIAAVGIQNTNLHWIIQNQRNTQAVLKKWPGLKTKYEQLTQAHITQRLPIDKLPMDLHATETLILDTLNSPWQTIKDTFHSRYHAQPVALWLYQQPISDYKIKKSKDDSDSPS